MHLCRHKSILAFHSITTSPFRVPTRPLCVSLSGVGCCWGFNGLQQFSWGSFKLTFGTCDLTWSKDSTDFEETFFLKKCAPNLVQLRTNPWTKLNDTSLAMMPYFICALSTHAIGNLLFSLRARFLKSSSSIMAGKHMEVLNIIHGRGSSHWSAISSWRNRCTDNVG